MKKVFLVLGVSLIGFSSFFTSCSKPKVETTQSKPAASTMNGNVSVNMTNSEYIAAMENLGIVHNACMDYMKEQVQHLVNLNMTPTTKAEFDQMLLLPMQHFMQVNGYDVNNLSSFQLANDYDQSQLSPEAAEIMSDFKSVMEKYGEDEIGQDQFVDAISALQQRSYNLMGDEKFIIGAAVTVGKHSTLYWEQNLSTYGTLDINNAQKMSPSQKAVGYADVVGAVKGGWTGAGGGPVGLILGAAGGAVCNSFATAILIGPLKDKFGWISDFFG
ncbi:hypothetical protein [Edaphocola aurantiacus]|uniref:hypothetical protein n=1 Tax=Edaphocola aurantiacus TaxID=2601682 RepID=UPI001C98677A|nr:hypothetical protein [Edaphocola aurantiacus]